MKKLQKGFTLSEMLVAFCIIGVIAGLMISIMGDKVDRNKALFKKAYSITERTVVELVNDETYYPYDFDNFGFKETTDVKIVGADYFTSTTDYDNPNTTTRTTCDKLIKFCNLFSNNLNIESKPVFSGSPISSCSFSTTDGIYWQIQGSIAKINNDPITGFLIEVDTNGINKEPNKPSSKAKVAANSEGNTKNRDVFYIYVRDDGKMQLPDNDEIAKSYLKSSNMNKE